MPEKQIFEIPQQLRELAEKNVEQARTAYGQFMDAMAQSVSAWSSASSDTVTSGFKAVQEQAIHFARKTPRLPSRWRANSPRPRTSKTCLPFRAVILAATATRSLALDQSSLLFFDLEFISPHCSCGWMRTRLQLRWRCRPRRDPKRVDLHGLSPASRHSPAADPGRTRNALFIN